MSGCYLLHHSRILLPFSHPAGLQSGGHSHSFSSPGLILSKISSGPVCFFPTKSFSSKADRAKLGLPENASKSEVKSAYFSLAKKLHPDNGGDAQRFNEITEAYKRITSDVGYPPGHGGQSQYYNQSQYGSGAEQDPRWQEEMERRRMARRWMEQKILEEEWARRRAHQRHWQAYQSGRINPDRERLVRAFMMPLVLLIMGSMVAFQVLFYSIIPSGCSKYAHGCTCSKCMEHERYMRQLGGPSYNRLGHRRGCECDVCIATGFQYLQHPAGCKCQSCRANF